MGTADLTNGQLEKLLIEEKCPVEAEIGRWSFVGWYYIMYTYVVIYDFYIMHRHA